CGDNDSTGDDRVRLVRNRARNRSAFALRGRHERDHKGKKDMSHPASFFAISPGRSSVRENCLADYPSLCYESSVLPTACYPQRSDSGKPSRASVVRCAPAVTGVCHSTERTDCQRSTERCNPARKAPVLARVGRDGDAQIEPEKGDQVHGTANL